MNAKVKSPTVRARVSLRRMNFEFEAYLNIDEWFSWTDPFIPHCRHSSAGEMFLSICSVVRQHPRSKTMPNSQKIQPLVKKRCIARA